MEDATSREVFPGASVRIHSLESALGAKLNGCEGVVESWNAATCRWQVRISAVGLKAIRDENLEPLHPGKGPPETRESRTSDTISIYRLLCHDGVTAVHETDFQGVVQRLLPQSQEQIKKFLYLYDLSTARFFYSFFPHMSSTAALWTSLDLCFVQLFHPGGCYPSALMARWMCPRHWLNWRGALTKLYKLEMYPWVGSPKPLLCRS